MVFFVRRKNVKIILNFKTVKASSTEFCLESFSIGEDSSLLTDINIQPDFSATTAVIVIIFFFLYYLIALSTE